MGHEPLIARHWLELLTKTVPPEEGGQRPWEKRISHSLQAPMACFPGICLISPPVSRLLQQQCGCLHKGKRSAQRQQSFPSPQRVPTCLRSRGCVLPLPSPHSHSWDNVSGKQWAGLHLNHQQPTF